MEFKGYKMKKLILAFTLGFTPFLSLAFDGLFDNPDLDKGAPNMVQNYTFDCSVLYNGQHVVGNGSWGSEPTQEQMKEVCQGDVESYLSQNVTFPYGCPLDHTEWKDAGILLMFYYDGLSCDSSNPDSIKNLTFPSYVGNLQSVDSIACPPSQTPDNTYPRDTNNDGVPNECYDPKQLDLLDDCNTSSGNEILDVAVTSPQGCFTQEDGSVCSYIAVTTMSGQQYYAMDLEGSCYHDDAVSLNGNSDGLISEAPTQTQDDFSCNGSGGEGGLYTCAENESDFTDLEGNPDEGCGTLNGTFVCVSGDIDGDTIPDYLDPDVDGDGVRNQDDIDADGDGKDDVIKRGSDSGAAAVVVNVDVSDIEIDLSPVVKELVEIKDLLKGETEIERITEPTKELVGFYESVYEDGVEGMFEGKTAEFQETEFYLFLNQFKPSFGGSPPDMSFCMNFGTYMNLGCFTLVLDPRIFPALKIFILITAGFTCRKIIFGG
jgi:hypothetical protein